MSWQIIFYLTSILLTAVLSAGLALYAWRSRGAPGSRAYARLALAQFALALAENLSVVAPTSSWALFWFQVRYLAGSLMAVFWLVFALEYSGRQAWLSKRFWIGLFLVPGLTQVLLWSNSLHGLWVEREAGFVWVGSFWLAEIDQRLPGPGYLTHIFYIVLLVLAGIALLFLTAWKLHQKFASQAVLLTLAGLTAFFFTFNSLVGFLPPLEFNPFTPGLGLSVVLIALAVFRYQFLKQAPDPTSLLRLTHLEAHERRSLALYLLILLMIVTGFSAGAFLSYQHYERQFRAEVEAQLVAIVQVKSEQLVEWRTSRLGDGEALRANPTFARLLQAYLEDSTADQARSQLQAWLNSLDLAYAYDQVLLLDAQGQLLLASSAQPLPSPAHLAENARLTLAAEQVVFLDFHSDFSLEKIYLAVLVPIFSEASPRRALGVVVLRIDPASTLYPFLARWPVASETAETLLVRREGQTIVFLNPLRFDADAPLNRRIPLSQTETLAVKAVLGQTGVAVGRDYRDQAVLGALAAVPDSPWFLVGRMDLDEVYFPLRERLRQTILFYAILVTISGIMLFLSWRQQRLSVMRRQLETLEALRVSEEKFRLAFDTSPDALVITRLSDGVFVSVNQGFEHLTGYTQAEVLGQSSHKIRLWKDPEAHRRAVEILRLEGEVRNFEATFLTKSGEIYGLSSSALIQINGEPHILNITRDITERMRAELILRENEINLSALIENTDGSIWAVDDQYRLIVGNREFHRNTSQALGRPLQMGESVLLPGFPPEVSAEWQELYDRVLRGESFTHESLTRFRAAPLYMEYRFSPILEAHGNIRGVTVYGRDITERKQAEAERELLFNTLAVSLNEIYIFSAETLKFQYVNSGALQNLQLTLEQARQLTPLDIKPEFTVSLWQALVAPLLSGEKQVQVFETVHLRADHTRYPVEVHLQYFEKERVFLAVIQDITERKQTQDLLRETNAYLENLFEYANAPIIVWDAQCKITRFNRAFEMLTGRLAAEVLGAPLEILFPPAEAQASLELIRQTQTGERWDVVEINIQPLNGSIRTVLWNSATLFAPDGVTPLATIAQGQDITERKLAEQKLAEYSLQLSDMVDERTRELRDAQDRLVRQERLAVLGQLAGSVSHELRNPLGVISNAVYYLSLAQPTAEPKIKEYLEIIQSETRIADKIVADLLNYARFKSAESEPVSVENLISRTLERYPVPVNVEVTLKIAPTLPLVWVDASQVMRVLGNLLVNAYQAMEFRGAVVLRAQFLSESGLVSVAVEDTGAGIPPENLTKIFEPLFTTKARGIGLGLAICKNLVESNGGRIEVTSEVGRGSTFTIYLPVNQEFS